jgi:hypothetical protein
MRVVFTPSSRTRIKTLTVPSLTQQPQLPLRPSWPSITDMKKLFLSLLFSCCACLAQGYIYFGFTQPSMNQGASLGDDVYTSATSSDGINWKNSGGSWAGQINAPQALLSNGIYYLHVATAYDGNLNFTTWKIGTRNNSTGVVTDTLTVDWASAIPGLYSVFSGTWYVEGGNGNVCSATPTKCHLFIPASITDASHFSIYETHATSWPPATSADFSAPVAITVDESNIYDSAVWYISPSSTGPCFMLFTHGTSGGAHFVSLAESKTIRSLACLGPYTTIYGDGALFPANHEGPTLYATSATTWRLAAEDISAVYLGIGTPQFDMIYYRDCNVYDVAVCIWGPMQLWTEDTFYRHGWVGPK